MLERVYRPRPEWYEEFYASEVNTSTKSCETEVSVDLRGKAKKV
ncbi:hypothetical protein Patl1_15966 [Pistacia atlantica]|uniref:Uncharacterized protein n=1 Tax=Pistacia atlantica TaxID=434234 RepID=A0ACC1B8N8_9ROSI|nr:hypothetical protein Patl1_15966 [Pistacia atlantica]